MWKPATRNSQLIYSGRLLSTTFSRSLGLEAPNLNPVDVTVRKSHEITHTHTHTEREREREPEAKYKVS